MKSDVIRRLTLSTTGHFVDRTVCRQTVSSLATVLFLSLICLSGKVKVQLYFFIYLVVVVMMRTCQPVGT